MRTGCRACDASRCETLPRRALRKASASLAADDKAGGVFVRHLQDGIGNAFEGLFGQCRGHVPVLGGVARALLRHLAGRGLFLLVQVGPSGSKAAKAPASRRVAIVSQTVSTTATGRSSRSAAAPALRTRSRDITVRDYACRMSPAVRRRGHGAGAAPHHRFLTARVYVRSRRAPAKGVAELLRGPLLAGRPEP